MTTGHRQRTVTAITAFSGSRGRINPGERDTMHETAAQALVDTGQAFFSDDPTDTMERKGGAGMSQEELAARSKVQGGDTASGPATAAVTTKSTGSAPSSDPGGRGSATEPVGGGAGDKGGGTGPQLPNAAEPGSVADISEKNATDAITMIREAEELPALLRWLVDERAGKQRSTVITALEQRIEARANVNPQSNEQNPAQ